MALQTAYDRAVRAYNDDLRKYRRYLGPAGRVVTEKRADPAEADEGEIIHVKIAEVRRSRKPPRPAHRPRVIDHDKLRRMVRDQPGLWTLENLVKRFAYRSKKRRKKVPTLRHVMRILAKPPSLVKLLKQPARRP